MVGELGSRRATPSLLGGVRPAVFLRDYWQKRPLLVRGAFPGFRDPLTPDELAGLACEEGVESRLVRSDAPRGTGARRRRWDVTWGPQREELFAELPETRWTILVQEVNRHVSAAAELLEAFVFLPNVRVDDVMVSFAAPGGGVGPHVDSYDVFLVQGGGERRWRFGTRPCPSPSFVRGLDLRVLRRFTPDADEVLRAGDMLYLPPGFAHDGIAVTPCMTYSVGFRAPRAAEAWTAFAAHAAGASSAEALLADPPLRPASNPGEIPRALRERVRALVRSMDTSDDAIDRWFASFATQLKPGHAMTPPRRPPSLEAIVARLERGDVVRRSEEGRFAFLPRRAGRLLLFVAGEEIVVESAAAPFARLVAARRELDAAALARVVRSPPARALLTRLFAMGALTFPASGRRRGN